MDSSLEQLQQALKAAVEGMSEAQMRWHPAGKRCAGEVLEHLYLTYTGTVKGFERVLEAGKPLATRASLRQHVQTLVVFTFNYLPEGRKAPKATVPKGLQPEAAPADAALQIATKS